MRARVKSHEYTWGGEGTSGSVVGTIFLWTTPAITPIAFGIVLELSFLEQCKQLVPNALRSVFPLDPEGMFVIGWVLLTVVCSGIIAWSVMEGPIGLRRILELLSVSSLVVVALLMLSGLITGIGGVLFGFLD